MNERNERCDFAAAVKAMTNWVAVNGGNVGYISAEEAVPFLVELPKFWQEPARVMACCGYYASAEDWMLEHAQ